MKKTNYSVTGRIELFETIAAPWRYLFIPFDKVPDVDPGGWGSIPVTVTVGKSEWKTSIFPLKKAGYFLPIKKLILKQESLALGDTITATYTTNKTVF